jgi:gliding motility-associated lipoprotein GldH
MMKVLKQYSSILTSYNLYFFSIVIFLLSSCNPNRIYEENIDIPKNVWDKNFKTTYQVSITDTTQLYRLSVNVRHTNFFQFSNLWITIYTTFPDGKTLSKRVELPLSGKEGKWHGECLGDICDVNISIQEKTRFNQLGKHTFVFEQIMRNKSLNLDQLPGIMAMGLLVEKIVKK